MRPLWELIPKKWTGPPTHFISHAWGAPWNEMVDQVSRKLAKPPNPRPESPPTAMTTAAKEAAGGQAEVIDMITVVIGGSGQKETASVVETFQEASQENSQETVKESYSAAIPPADDGQRIPNDAFALNPGDATSKVAVGHPP